MSEALLVVAGLGFTSALAAFFFFFMGRELKKSTTKVEEIFEQRLFAPARAAQAILRDGAPCSATVVALTEGWGGMKVVGENPLIKVTLDVTPLDPPGPTYRADCELVISYLHVPQYQPGCTLAVKADRADPSRVAIEGTNFALLDDVPRG